jgi:hypothetical protein
MIYTIGSTSFYSKGFADSAREGVVFEKGVGGSVWKTEEEARLFAREGYSVYGVLADWDKDTEPTPHEWNALIVDAPLVRLGGWYG